MHTTKGEWHTQSHPLAPLPLKCSEANNTNFGRGVYVSGCFLSLSSYLSLALDPAVQLLESARSFRFVFIPFKLYLALSLSHSCYNSVPLLYVVQCNSFVWEFLFVSPKFSDSCFFLLGRAALSLFCYCFEQSFLYYYFVTGFASLHFFFAIRAKGKNIKK